MFFFNLNLFKGRNKIYVLLHMCRKTHTQEWTQSNVITCADGSWDGAPLSKIILIYDFRADKWTLITVQTRVHLGSIAICSRAFSPKTSKWLRRRAHYSGSCQTNKKANPSLDKSELPLQQETARFLAECMGFPSFPFFFFQWFSSQLYPGRNHNVSIINDYGFLVRPPSSATLIRVK